MDRRGIFAVVVERGAVLPSLASQRVAGLTLFLAKEAFTDRGISRRIERTDVVQKGEQARHFRSLKHRAHSMPFFEQMSHARRVIPHHAGNIEQRTLQEALAEVGAADTADAADRVAT